MAARLGAAFDERVHGDAGTGTCRQFRYPQDIAKPGPAPILGGMALVVRAV
jgi:hypothetical protein